MPDRLIMYMDRPYILLSVKKKKEYSARNIIDDIEFDIYESGVRMEFEVAPCGFEEIAPGWRIYLEPGQTCLEVFEKHRIEIPNDKIRKMYMPLLKKSKMLIEEREKESDDIQKTDSEEEIYPFS